MIGKNIAALRKKLNLSQEEVAEKIGVARQTVAKWENEESIPDVLRCNALADLFDISLDNLVNFEIGEAGAEDLPPKGKYVFGVVTVGEKGQIVIPVKARRIFGIRPGDNLLVLGDDERELALVDTRFFLECMGKQ